MKVKGIVHVTEAVGINAVRELGTGLANFFGKKGFESKLYDTVKENAFVKLNNQIPDKYTGNIKGWILKPHNQLFFAI